MNLRQFGVAAFAAMITLSGASTSCATVATKQAQIISKTPDKLTRWVVLEEQGEMPVPTRWRLVVNRLVDVRKEFESSYTGVALIRKDEPCFAVLGRMKDGKMSAEMYSRHNDAYSAMTPMPLGKDDFTSWMLLNGLECAAEATRAP